MTLEESCDLQNRAQQWARSLSREILDFIGAHTERSLGLTPGSAPITAITIAYQRFSEIIK